MIETAIAIAVSITCKRIKLPFTCKVTGKRKMMQRVHREMILTGDFAFPSAHAYKITTGMNRDTERPYTIMYKPVTHGNYWESPIMADAWKKLDRVRGDGNMALPELGLLLRALLGKDGGNIALYRFMMADEGETASYTVEK